MNTTELKVGQKWRVVDAKGFSCPFDSQNGDVLCITHSVDTALIESWRAYNLTREQGDVIFYPEDISEGYVELLEDIPYSDALEEVESVSQEGTGTSQEILDAAHTCVGISRDSVDSSEGIRMYKHGKPTDSKDILWHIISRAEKFNGHSQFRVSEMDLSTLITLTRMLDDYVTEFCELRLSWGGDHMGYYTADIYEIASARDGAEDKILMQVERVTGVL